MTTTTLTMRRRPAPPRSDAGPVVSNVRLAMAILITAESMLFAGLIGMYIVFRLSARTWPPADLPRLPLGITTVNTVILFGSLIPMWRALSAIRHGAARPATRALGLTAVLGTVFLAVQGLEWVRLVRHGLTLASGVYGGAFYVLIGCHGAHVLAAVVWLAAVTWLAHRRRFTAHRHDGVEMCAVYWAFVCALWGVLFPLVYLS